MLAPRDRIFAGMGEVAKGLSGGGAEYGGNAKGGWRCCHWVKRVLRAWGQLPMGFEVLALAEMCFKGMAAVGKGV